MEFMEGKQNPTDWNNKLDKILHDAGISGEAGCTNEALIKAGSSDKLYTKTRQLVEKGRRTEIEGEYKRVANALNSDGKLLLKEGKLVIPKGDGTLRQNIVRAAHEGHPGMSQVKSRLRDEWFRGHHVGASVSFRVIIYVEDAIPQGFP